MTSNRAAPATAIRAPAKLNLFLEVVGKRGDGFHELVTVMTTLNLYDSLALVEWEEPRGAADLGRWSWGQQARERGPSAEPPLGDLPHGQANIVRRALDRWTAEAARTTPMSYRLVKRIPSTAGLGGGSSDAAAALLAANRLAEEPSPTATASTATGLGQTEANEGGTVELDALAAELGSDVPFFLSGGSCVCRGRGELVRSVPFPGRLDVVLVKPPHGLSTAEVFRCCQVAERPREVEPMLDALATGDRGAVGRLLFNRLQLAAESLSPWVGRLRAVFHRLGVLGHQLSGSGTCYFGICRHASHARRVEGVLRNLRVGRVFRACNEVSPHRERVVSPY